MIYLEAYTIGEFFASVWQLARSVWALDPAAFRVVLDAPGSATVWVVMALVLLAGLSDTLGQSVVLFANRVRRRRFAISLVMYALVFVLAVLAWAALVWLLAQVLFGVERPFRDVFLVVSASHAPMLFGFLALLPYLGNAIDHILRIWVLLALMVGTAVTYDFGFAEALTCAILGWMLIELITHFPALHFDALGNWFWRVTTGTTQRLQTQEIVDRYIEARRNSFNDRENKS